MSNFIGYGLSLFFVDGVVEASDKLWDLLQSAASSESEKIFSALYIRSHPVGDCLAILLKETLIDTSNRPILIPNELIVDREEATQQIFSWCEENQVEIPDGSVMGWWLV